MGVETRQPTDPEEVQSMKPYVGDHSMILKAIINGISFLLFLNLIFFKKMKMEREDGDWIIIGSGISFLSNAMFSTNSKPLIGEHSKG